MWLNPDRTPLPKEVSVVDRKTQKPYGVRSTLTSNENIDFSEGGLNYTELNWLPSKKRLARRNFSVSCAKPFLDEYLD